MEQKTLTSNKLLRLSKPHVLTRGKCKPRFKQELHTTKIGSLWPYVATGKETMQKEGNWCPYMFKKF